MTAAPAVHTPVFRIMGARAPSRGRAKFLWWCTGPDHASWLVTMPNVETLGPFDDRRDAMARL